MSARNLYPLGKVKQIVEAVGMEVSYAHEELVFLEHNGLLLQFTENESEVRVHRNIKANQAELIDDLLRLQKEATSYGLLFSAGCPYRLSEVDAENIRIEFVEH